MDDSTPASIRSFIEAHLTTEEASRIRDQFSRSFRPNRQALWTGLNEEMALVWARKHNFQTLRMAMGPLMDRNHPDCPRRTAGPKQWVQYIHGASAIFALRISSGDVVTLLTQPPPERFHPSGATSYLVLEEPIVKGKLGNQPVKRIQIVHPTVTEASETTYTLWPKDAVAKWVSLHGLQQEKAKWREVSLRHVDGFDQCTTSIQKSPTVTASLIIPAQEQIKAQGASQSSRKARAEERIRLNELQVQRRRAQRERGKQQEKCLEEKQAQERKSGGKKKRPKGKSLHEQHTQEIRNLKEELDRAARHLYSQEVSERKSLKEKHRSEVVAFERAYRKKGKATSKKSAGKEQQPQATKIHPHTNLTSEQQSTWMAGALLYTFVLLLKRNRL